MRQLTTFFILLFLLTIARYPYDAVAQKLFDRISRQLATHGVILNASRIDYSFPAAVDLDDVNLAVANPGARFPLLIDSLVIDTAKLWIKIPRLLLLKADLQGKLNVWQGNLDISAERWLFGEQIALKATAQGLSLAHYHTTSQLGIAGTLAFDLLAKLADSTQSERDFPLEKGTVSLKIEQGSYPGGHTIGGLFPLPAFNDFHAQVMIEHSQRTMQIPKADLQSSLGTVSGKGQLELAANPSNSAFSAELELELSAEGLNSLGGYLALAAGLPVDTQHRRWSIRANRKLGPGVPDVQIRALN